MTPFVLKCCVLDDMPDAVAALEEYITGTYGLELTGSFTDPLEALAHLRKSPPHVLFCDIDMPGMNGIEMAKTIRESLLPVQVIFTTAHPQHAVESYRLYALDYLVKPVNRSLFAEAIQRAIDYIEHHTNFGELPMSLLVKTIAGNMQRITINDIYYVEIDKNYSTIYFANSKIVSAMTLKEAESRLRGYRFLRSHKSFLVAEQYIDTISAETIQLTNGAIVPLSRSYKPAFMVQFR